VNEDGVPSFGSDEAVAFIRVVPANLADFHMSSALGMMCAAKYSGVERTLHTPVKLGPVS
jgi:hypothetical protein